MNSLRLNFWAIGLTSSLIIAISLDAVAQPHRNSSRVGNKDSNDRAGQVVEIEMIKAPTVAPPVGLGVQPEMMMMESFPAAFAPFLVGVAVDVVKAHLEKVASEYEAQFQGTAYAEKFWRDDSGNLEYSGFKVRRYTDRYPKAGGRPAFEFEAKFVPSTNDGRFILVQPVSVQTRSARARVHRGAKGSFETQITMQVDASWFDDKDKPQSGTLMSANWKLSGQKLSETPTTLANNEQNRIGWFVMPTSKDAVGVPGKPGGTPFKITVMVTEKDESKAKETIERIATFVGDQKDKIVDSVK